MISCLKYVDKRKEELREEVSNFAIKPKLTVIQIGNDKASSSYIKSKKKLCEEIGVNFIHNHIQEYEDLGETYLTTKILQSNINSDGIIVQLPIPDKYDIKNLQTYIVSDKDVDGFRRDSSFTSCTPKGIIDWLEFNDYIFEGKNITVIGRSNIVGKPLVNLLIEKGATVTCCNSKTKDLRKHTQNSDLVVSAVGKAKFLDSSYFVNGQIVVDVGINRDENGKLCGDVNYEEVTSKLENIYVTPVPNGVGKLTVLSLIENTIEAYKLKNN